MKGLAAVLVSAFFFHAAGNVWMAPWAQAQAPAAAANAAPPLTIPAGGKIDLAVIRPVWARTTKPGDTLYAQTTFPVVAGNRIAIPPGTYVMGTIEKLTPPTRRSGRAQLQVLFTKIIFVNGYVLTLPGATSAIAIPPGPAALSGASAAPQGTPRTLIAIEVQVSRANHLLLDNGAQIEITLTAPLSVDAKRAAAAVPLSRAPQPGQFKSASLCRPIPGSPGTPGTPDTVIPGSQGTPDTVIPGGPGMPDIVIPGTPATPDTVIPGSPGTPGTSDILCPSPPIVLSCKPVATPGRQGRNSTSAVH